MNTLSHSHSHFQFHSLLRREFDDEIKRTPKWKTIDALIVTIRGAVYVSVVAQCINWMKHQEWEKERRKKTQANQWMKIFECRTKLLRKFLWMNKSHTTSNRTIYSLLLALDIFFPFRLYLLLFCYFRSFFHFFFFSSLPHNFVSVENRFNPFRWFFPQFLSYNYFIVSVIDAKKLISSVQWNFCCLSIIHMPITTLIER